MKTLPSLRHAMSPIRGLALALVLTCSAGAHAQGVQANAGVQSAPGTQSTQSASRPQLADAIVAVVNSDVITRQELLSRMKEVEARMRQQNIPVPPRAEFQRQLLERMIIDKAQMHLAADEGIRVDDALLDRAIQGIAEQNKMTVAQLRDQLQREGTSFTRFREEIREEITMQRLREREVDNKLQISESEVDAFLEAQAANAANQQELNLSHILIAVPENASAEQIADRRRRAEGVLQQIQAGGDFARIAASYSDASDALKGGEVGWRTQERLPQLFVDAVSNLQPGQVTPILRGNNGFHIVKLVDRRAASGGAKAGPSVQQTHARHILIKVNQVVTAAEARRKLMELKERLDNKAAKFDELAKLYSNDLSASKGGDLGWLYPGDTVPEFERVMNALKIGEVSEPVQSPFGFHLIQVLERKTDDVSRERQRLAARQALRERKLDEAMQDWLRQLRDRAYVEYRPDALEG
ncbi:molecular chaperone SurA [Oxalobacteraceae bacterium OM1]|nr:molecular chaperone SurA [Oxalobacteraceae bacterium OM1]